MAEGTQSSSGGGGAKSASSAKSDVMLPEFQPGSSSQPVAEDAEALAKKQAANDAAEAKEMDASSDDALERQYGHMRRGSDR